MLGMQTEGRRDEDGVETGLLFEHLAMVEVDRSFGTGQAAALLEARLPNVAQSSDPHAGHAKKASHHVLSSAADTDDTDRDAVAGLDVAALRANRPTRQQSPSGTEGCGLEEVASAETSHGEATILQRRPSNRCGPVDGVERSADGVRGDEEGG